MEERKVIEADEIRVGPLVITKTPDGGAGIWLGDEKKGPMIAVYQTANQTGVGVYCKGGKGLTCFSVDENGDGMIQFAKADGEVAYLTFEQVKNLGK